MDMDKDMDKVMVSQSRQNSSNPWICWHIGRNEPTLDVVSHTKQSSISRADP
jgi:hypothetical protein